MQTTIPWRSLSFKASSTLVVGFALGVRVAICLATFVRIKYEKLKNNLFVDINNIFHIDSGITDHVGQMDGTDSSRTNDSEIN